MMQPRKADMCKEWRSIQVELTTHSDIAQSYCGSPSPRISGALQDYIRLY